MYSITNELEIALCGMSRSGNHALTHWLLSQANGRACHLNCAEGKTNPFLSCRPLDSGACFEATFQMDMEAERRGCFSHKHLLIHSYEDSFLAHAYSRHFEERHDAFVGRSRRRVNMIVLRDPYNLFASRQRAGMITNETARRIWKQHARAFLRRDKSLRRETVCVSFNRWARSRSYRRWLAELLGIEFTDDGIDDVADCGGGSSFDGRSFNQRARLMAVGDRWRHFRYDADYWRSIDQQMADLSRHIFGDVLRQADPAEETPERPARVHSPLSLPVHEL